MENENIFNIESENVFESGVITFNGVEIDFVVNDAYLDGENYFNVFLGVEIENIVVDRPKDAIFTELNMLWKHDYINFKKALNNNDLTDFDNIYKSVVLLSNFKNVVDNTELLDEILRLSNMILETEEKVIINNGFGGVDDSVLRNDESFLNTLYYSLKGETVLFDSVTDETVVERVMHDIIKSWIIGRYGNNYNFNFDSTDY